jgi:hypothetical protein
MWCRRDYEFSFQPYSTPMPHQRFIERGLQILQKKFQCLKPKDARIYGSKNHTSIYDFLRNFECSQLYMPAGMYIFSSPTPQLLGSLEVKSISGVGMISIQAELDFQSQA